MWMTASAFAVAAAPTPEEMETAGTWVRTRMLTDGAAPFSFGYHGTSSKEFLGKWAVQRDSSKLDASRTRHTVQYRDPASGLVVRCVSVEYHDFPTVEWAVFLKNEGTSDSAIIEDIQPLDLSIDGRGGADPVLHHNVGSPCAPNDYQPLETVLSPGTRKRISAAGGRPSNSDLPYFNLQWGEGGTIIAVGWPGQWAAEFSRESEASVRLRAGQELTHLVLRPGEEIRTPLVAMQFYRGDSVRAQNVWRRWMVAHNIPRPGGKLVPTHYASCWGNMIPNAAEEMGIFDGLIREGFKPDFWILDAGWYINKGTWTTVGTWEVDKARFPNGLRGLADHVHEKGSKFVVWFEPERVTPDTWLTNNHPEWILGGAKGGLLNLGNPEALKWVLERIDGLLTSEHIDVYRQDFNIDPLEYWRANDTPDRQGITEIRHVEGYLAFWDELLRRHPGLWIDSCASGGRRNDLETLRRAVPLLRSDYFADPDYQQCQTMGISQWMPYYGSGLGTSGTYWFRSCIFPASRVGWDTRKRDLDYDLLRRMVAEFRQVEPYLLGDFYALTPYSLDRNVWAAWQFDRPESGAGFVQVFRRAECTQDTMTLHLQGLTPEERYTVTNLDTKEAQTRTGREWATAGLTVQLAAKPAAAIYVYSSVPTSSGSLTVPRQ
jgi:alpha-galactosidase